MAWPRLPRDLRIEVLAFLEFREFCGQTVRTSRDFATSFDSVRIRIEVLVRPRAPSSVPSDVHESTVLSRMIDLCPRVTSIRPATGSRDYDNILVGFVRVILYG